MHSDYYLPTLTHIGLAILTWFFPLTCSRCDITTTKQRIILLLLSLMLSLSLSWSWSRSWLLSSPLPWGSGYSVAIQCAWNLHPNIHWNATGEILVGTQCVSNVFPMVFHGLPVCSNYASYHGIATGTPLGDSISKCGSSGIPVYP